MSQVFTELHHALDRAAVADDLKAAQHWIAEAKKLASRIWDEEPCQKDEAEMEPVILNFPFGRDEGKEVQCFPAAELSIASLTGGDDGAPDCVGIAMESPFVPGAGLHVRMMANAARNLAAGMLSCANRIDGGKGAN